VDEAALGALRDEEVGADVLLPATIGRAPGYVAALISTLRPRWVIPHHFDDFFVPIDEARRRGSDLPDLERFRDEVRAIAASLGLEVSVRVPEFFEPISLPPAAASGRTASATTDRDGGCVGRGDGNARTEVARVRWSR
jgi:hypothetical protein